MIYWRTAKTNFDNLQKTLEEVTNDRFRVLNVLQQPGMTGTEYVVVAFRMVSDKPRRDNRHTMGEYNDVPSGDETEGNV